MKDFLIVGRGLAGTCLMHVLYRQQLSFDATGDQNASSCSLVAAGIWNPVVFKRLTKSWLADELVNCLLEFYRECEALLNVKLINERRIIKPFSEQQEKILWISRARNELDEFLDPVCYPSSQAPSNLDLQTEFGLVNRSGNLDVPRFLKSSADYFNDCVRDEWFEYADLTADEPGWTFKGKQYRNVIFCEGWLVKNNPFFRWIPLKPAKGEVLTAEIKDLSLGDKILNKGNFLLETGNSIFKTGSSYEWTELNEDPTPEIRELLEGRLKKMVTCSYTITKQEAGVRPSSVDRRPIIGPHPKYPNLFVFNGMGTKGVMLCPYFSRNFVNFYLQKEQLHPEINLSRFYHLYEKIT